MLFTVVIFIITLLVLVVIHELGHFLMAKKFNIKVEEFGFGIPPKAWGKKVGETLVSVNWLPFGGFVRLLGEDEVNKQILENKRSFAAQTVWKRIIVVVAGVVMNLLLAWLIFYIVLGFSGFKWQLPLLTDYKFFGVNEQVDNAILIQQIQPNSPASQVGLKQGLEITAVNGQPYSQIEDFSARVRELAGSPASLTILDPETKATKTIIVTPRLNPPPGQGSLGVALVQLESATLIYETPIQKLLAGPIHSINIVAYSGEIIGKLVGESFKTKSVEPVSQTVSGPVGITSVVNSILTENKDPLLPYLDFVAVLSLNLAVMNVLPFPALDGGRLLFLVIEAITRKRVHAEIERWVHTVGMAILLTLMLLVTFSDLHKIF